MAYTLKDLMIQQLKPKFQAPPTKPPKPPKPKATKKKKRTKK
tara:strand:- start:1856 stop:1981 length:126 start_codon:yes stop_codon:yes gene_type:complete